MESLEEDELDFAIIMTKIDKANQKTVSQNLKSLKQQVQKTISYLPDIIMSSSVKKS
jgi:GTP-binding protein EngB required for normal cell division